MRLKTLAALLAGVLTTHAATLPQTPTNIYNVVYAVPESQNIESLVLQQPGANATAEPSEQPDGNHCVQGVRRHRLC
ncbi:hypothetical protein B0H16DRAFT_1512912 [Mycena metata]|uniref:Uncharacterized protein n=1 Tax=Mycena metata TaxID=1033252 RepID=A0AAD7NR85_9AGAR|nr:hypothetical protein B0H16DRAFT_1512912 [Mycena metata]